ncbi:MAG: hypothetical protein JO254_00630, partial [Pseudolabrys sp.]|nr:hypothetical protein [Pseudolabrys sp.]
MDDRGRLAQPLTANIACALSAAAHRTQRLGRRVFSPLYDLDPPRGLGSLLVGAFLAAASAYGVV